MEAGRAEEARAECTLVDDDEVGYNMTSSWRKAEAADGRRRQGGSLVSHELMHKLIDT